MNFNNKTVLVTGSSRGIGRAIAIEFAKKGANVVINYRKDTIQAEIVKTVIESYGVKCLIIKTDIGNEKEVIEMITTTIKEFGTIDILVNNASIAIDLPFEEREVSHWQETINTNLIGMFLTSKYASKYMMEQKFGKIINISSTNGIATTSTYSIDYDASKAAVINFTRNMADQLSPYVNVNCIAPGWVETDMNEGLPKAYLKKEKEKIMLKRFAEPEEIASVVSFIASDEARYINGETIRVDGGM